MTTGIHDTQFAAGGSRYRVRAWRCGCGRWSQRWKWIVERRLDDTPLEVWVPCVGVRGLCGCAPTRRIALERGTTAMRCATGERGPLRESDMSKRRRGVLALVGAIVSALMLVFGLPFLAVAGAEVAAAIGYLCWRDFEPERIPGRGRGQG